MIDKLEIQKLVKMIVTFCAPERIILFGSYARQEAQVESDIDVLILVADNTRDLETIRREIYQKATDILDIPCDIIVKRKSDFLERAKLPTLERAILREGHVLYAA